ncbi:MAG TPA: hypothetical protein VJ917_00730 [Saprospiraceae bacterium]|nr:hypothetical protein [Saprospiraceae bacterium]
MSSSSNKTSDQLLLLAVVLSGFAALAFEIVWTRILSLLLGAEMVGVLGVLTGFFGGMMLGAWLTSGHAHRDSKPVKTFIILEIIIAVYGFVLPYIFFGIHEQSPLWFTSLFSIQAGFWSLTLAVLFSGLLMLPATFCMGANFAYLVAASRRYNSSVTKSNRAVGRIYAANTFGAVLGTLTAVYFFLPSLGFIGGSICFSLVSLLAAGTATIYGRKIPKTKLHPTDTVGSNAENEEQINGNTSWLLLLFLTGLFGIAYEIAVVHGLKQVLENTVYSFANILSVYLLGAAAGSWWYQQKKAKGSHVFRSMRLALLTLSIFPLINMLLAVLIANERTGLAENNLPFALNLILEWSITALFFFVPAFMMGVLFPALFQFVHKDQTGKAYALNTLGSTLAPFIFGIVLLPILGGQWMLFFMAALYSLLVLWLRKRLDFQRTAIGIAGLLLLGALAIPKNPFLMNSLPDGWKILAHKEGYQGSVTVTELPDQKGPLGLPMRFLQVNGKFKMGGGASFLEKRMGHLPILQHASADTILFLGLGTATTLGTALEYPLDDITGVEIQPEITEILPFFSAFHNHALESPRTRIFTADARNFVRRTAKQYDLIVCDLYHPARDGAGMLYTKNHFENLRDILDSEGAVMQWLPLHQIGKEDLRVILRTFLSVFPEAHLVLASYNADTPVVGIYGSKKPVQWKIGKVQNLLYKKNIRASIENPADLTNSYICGPQTLKTDVGEGPINTDSHPRLIFEAPKQVYRPQKELAMENFRWILSLRNEFPKTLLSMDDPQLEARLQRQWNAAGLYLEYLYEKTAGKDKMAFQKLIDAYQLAPEFSPARGKVQQLIDEGKFSRRLLQ